MAQAYSMDLRQRVIAACDAGLGTKQVAIKYHVSPAWVRRLKQHRRERGDIKPRPGGHRPRLIDREQLGRLVAKRPDATQVELRQMLGIQCSVSAICMAWGQLKLTCKKKWFTPLSRTGRMWPNGVPAGVSNNCILIRRS